MRYGCIGEHLKHSFSREVHGLIADYNYELLELEPCEVESFLSARDFLAINVTIPYKETVIPHLSYIDEHASAIGAVNTIVNRDGRLYGYNTDFFGMTALIKRLGISLEGKKVLILGTEELSVTEGGEPAYLKNKEFDAYNKADGSSTFIGSCTTSGSSSFTGSSTFGAAGRLFRLSKSIFPTGLNLIPGRRSISSSFFGSSSIETVGLFRSLF